MNLDDLRKSPLFAGLSDLELQQLVDRGETVALHAGEVLMQQGSPGDAAFIVLDGGFEVYKQVGQSRIKIDVRAPGEVLGEMALLNQAPRMATVTALQDSRVLRIPQHAFEQLLSSNTSAVMAVLHSVVTRLNQNEALLHQQEKMAALGTLSAGLAHELNNPASAAQRSAAQLRESLQTWQQLTQQMEKLALEKNQQAWLEEVTKETTRRFRSPVKLDALERADQNDRLQTWLEARGIQTAWELAPAMTAFGWDISALERLQAESAAWNDGDSQNLLLEWMGLGCQIMSLFETVLDATERISKIVQAVKSYAYLDRAPVVEVDIHEGLENTLIILQHKLKNGVSIRREYAANLPRVEAYASELNQVWTNIIDNAIDAMQGKGEILLRTYAEDDHVVVEITDGGPGIPPKIQPRIFEPFFTTKPPGQGTGLGLHISHDIVANRHHGQILVTSRPGETCFRVILPRRIAQDAALRHENTTPNQNT